MENLKGLNEIDWDKKNTCRILIYGASMYGKFTYDYLKKHKKVDILGCLDRNYDKMYAKSFPIFVSDPSMINNFKFDYIIIASIVEHIIAEIYDFIKSNRVRDEQIILIHERDFKLKDKIFFSEDEEYKSFISEWEDYFYLREKYSNLVEIEKNENGTGTDSGITWMLWFQGWENAPDLIKKCRESVIRYNSGRRIIFLDEENYEKYVNIPSDIKQLYQKGIICAANFSDIIRLELLQNYGGLWLDASIYLSGVLYEYITESPLFVFQFPKGVARTISSWLMYARTDHIIIKETLKLLYLYWRTEDKNSIYYAMHYLFRIISDIYSDDWKKIPCVYNSNCFILQRELNHFYNEQRLQQIFVMSNVHKLNYRIKIDKEDSIYKHI